MSRWLIATTLLLSQLLVALPPASAAQDQATCDDLAKQIASEQQRLDQAKLDALPWLAQAEQFAAVAPGELAVAAAQGSVPGLTPGLAETYGGLIAQVGAQISVWRSANDTTAATDYLRDLISQVQMWEGQLGVLAPFWGYLSSLVGLNTSLSQLDQVLANAQADLAISDDLQAQLDACQAAAAPAPTPMPQPDEGGDSGALCTVGGQTGASRSDCFSLEMDAAYKVWAACTEQYFAAEQEAFRTGGDLPINTCDPAWRAAQDAIQQRWGAPPEPSE
jgi:hypothetical protein